MYISYPVHLLYLCIVKIINEHTKKRKWQNLLFLKTLLMDWVV